MKEVHLFLAPDIANTHELPAEEAAHAVRVLRMKEGDRMLVCDGKGFFYDCEISTADSKRCRVNILRVDEGKKYWKTAIHLAVAPTKNMDRMEWLSEKATEIGFDSISFLACKNSERRVVKTERIEKIIVSAVKQSHKAWMPEIFVLSVPLSGNLSTVKSLLPTVGSCRRNSRSWEMCFRRTLHR